MNDFEGFEIPELSDEDMLGMEPVTARQGNSPRQEMAGKVSGATQVKIGFLAGATYPDGKPVAMIASEARPR